MVYQSTHLSSDSHSIFHVGERDDFLQKMSKIIHDLKNTTYILLK